MIGCSPGLTTTDENSNSNTTPESSYCSSITAYSGSTITITGSAQFYYRPTEVYTYSSMQSVRLNGNPISETIKYAEVVLINSSNKIIQCGTTNSSGGFSLNIPKNIGNYSLKINSRSFNNFLKVSVLKDINSNSVYSISKSFSISSSDSSSKNIGTLSAYARQSESINVEGAAFNILNTLLISNEYIRTKTNDTAFVAPKVVVYWKAGFNPSSYYGGSSGVSFYMSGKKELYILGGMNGDIKSSDTDHFDNSVIIHEYGHFLEDVYASSDSPGGSHNGQRLIDPRLAWSEGFANFFAAEVQNWNSGGSWSYYADTKGFQNDTVEGGSSVPGFIINLNESASSANFDPVVRNGEGIFREVSIARTLYKTLHIANLDFEGFWSVFSNNLGNVNIFFKNSGLFLLNYYNSLSSTDQSSLSAIISEEKQSADLTYYAARITHNTNISATCATQYMSPVIESSVNDYLFLMNSNHYFTIDNRSGSIRNIKLYMINDGTPNIDLDLILYKYSYIYSSEDTLSSNATIQSKSISTQSGSITNQVVESINVPTGIYLLNVKAKTYSKTNSQISQGGGSISYKLISNDAGSLCPNTN